MSPIITWLRKFLSVLRFPKDTPGMFTPEGEASVERWRKAHLEAENLVWLLEQPGVSEEMRALAEEELRQLRNQP